MMKCAGEFGRETEVRLTSSAGQRQVRKLLSVGGRSLRAGASQLLASVHFRKVDLLQDNVHGWVLPSDWFTSSLTLSATQVVSEFPEGSVPLGQC